MLSSLKQLTPRPLKRLLREHLPADLITVLQGERPPEVIRDLNRLDEKLRELDQAAQVSDDALRAHFRTFRMDFKKDLPADPRSDEYRNAQLELYRWIAGKTYENANEKSVFNVQEATISPFPFGTKSADTVGNHLISIGHLIKAAAFPAGSRVLELGAGWGNTSEALARMGCWVTAVDIEKNFVELIKTRAASLGNRLNAVHDDFLYLEKVEEPFDAILFFESFHHASDHLRVIRALAKAVKPGGKVIFAAEPITDQFPIPWGLRMDGESLWAIRKHGWLELGFQETYFRETLAMHGWTYTKHHCPETPAGTVLVATRA
jgi:2-polyprenyl-3-methyl-5-hydroxy-6-metoxy-1,4-benzoquinol methylase